MLDKLPLCMVQETVRKTWGIADKIITMTERDNIIYCSVTQRGITKRISFYDVVGLPQAIDTRVLDAFLLTAQVRLSPLENNEYKLYIQSGLKGGSNVTKGPKKLWPNGLVPYEISLSKYPIDGEDRLVILNTIKIWNSARTGLRFVPRTTQMDVLVFGDDNETTSFHRGYQGGVQYVACSIPDSVLDKKQLLREMGRAVGLEDEHTSWGRGTSVHSPRNNDNIPSSQKSVHEEDNFSAIRHPVFDTPLERSANNAKTAFSISATECVDSVKLSANDIAALRHLYPLQLRINQFYLLQSAVITLYMNTTISPVSPDTLFRRPEWEIFRAYGNYFFGVADYKKALLYYYALIKEYKSYLPLSIIGKLHHLCGRCCYHLTEYKAAHLWYSLAQAMLPKSISLKKNYSENYKIYRKLIAL